MCVLWQRGHIGLLRMRSNPIEQAPVINTAKRTAQRGQKWPQSNNRTVRLSAHIHCLVLITHYIEYAQTRCTLKVEWAANRKVEKEKWNISLHVTAQAQKKVYIRTYIYLKTCSNRHTRCLTQPTSTTYGPSSQNCHDCLVLLAVEPKVIQWNATKLGGIVIYLIRIRQLQQKWNIFRFLYKNSTCIPLFILRHLFTCA